MKSSRYNGLDYLRFAAASVVVLLHYNCGERFGLFPNMLPAGAYGYLCFGKLGVELFFMISGFVILLTAENCAGGIREFAAGRFARLYPLYLFAVVFTYIHYLCAGNFTIGGYALAANLAFVAPAFKLPLVDGVYWTLYVELQFYALMAWLIFSNRLGRAIQWISVAVALLFFYQLYSKAHDNALHYYFGLTRYLHLFLAGMIVCKFRNRKNILFLALFGCSVPVLVSHWMGDYAFGEVEHYAAYWVMAGLLYVATSPSWKSGYIGPLLGDLSYPIYLVHFSMAASMYAIVGTYVGSPFIWWVNLLALIAVALAGVYFIDRPVRARLKNYMLSGNWSLSNRGHGAT